MRHRVKGKRRGSVHNKSDAAPSVIQEAQAAGELQTEILMLARASELEEHLDSGNPDGDSTWFARHLTERQRSYGLYFMQTAGDWKKSAQRAGYAARTLQRDIEQGDAMQAYMKAVRSEMAAVMAITSTTILARISRIGLKAEKQGDFGNALRASTKLGEAHGIFEHAKGGIQINGDGNTIVIGVSRSKTDDDIYEDAEWREIEAANGLAALPGGE
jgi:AraC-like DNA-binding protein